MINSNMTHDTFVLACCQFCVAVILDLLALICLFFFSKCDLKPPRASCRTACKVVAVLTGCTRSASLYSLLAEDPLIIHGTTEERITSYVRLLDKFLF